MNSKRQSMEKNNKKQKSVKTVVAFVVPLFAFLLVRQIIYQTPSFDNAMMEVASEINAVCPLMVDKDTRLDNALALPDNTFQYNYTLIHMEISQIDIEDLTNYLEKTIVNNVRTNPDLQIFRDNQTTMAYYYRDKNGVFMTKIEVAPEEYVNQ